MSRDKTRDPFPGGIGAWCSVRHGWVLTGLPCDSARHPARGQGLTRESGVTTGSSQTKEAVHANMDGNHWSLHSISEATFQVVVFHFCSRCHLYYIPDVAAQSQTGVKLNRVFFPRLALQVRSLDCRFAR
jgi:hypothetical protein